MTHPLKRRKLSFKICLSYIIIVLLMMLLSVILINVLFTRHVKNLTGKDSLERLNADAYMLEQVLKSVQVDGFTVVSSKEIDKLSGIRVFDRDARKAEAILNIADVDDYLADMVLNNENLDSVYLIIDNVDFVLSSDARVIKKNDIESVEWFKIAQELPLAKWTFVQKDWPSIRSVFVYTLPLQFFSQLKGRLVLCVSEETVCQLMNRKEAQGTTLILDQNGRVLSAENKERITTQIDDKIWAVLTDKQNRSGYFMSKEKEEQLLAYTDAGISDWKYVSMYPFYSLIKGLNDVMIIVDFGLLLLLMAGITVIYLLNKKQMHPLNRLIDSVISREDIKNSNEATDIDLLQTAFRELTEELQNKKQKEKADALLHALLYNEPYPDVKNDFMSEEGYHKCIVVSIDRNDEERVDEQRYYYLKKMVFRLCVDSIMQVYNCKAMDIKTEEAVLIVESEGEISDERLKEMLVDIQKHIESLFRMSASFGIGYTYIGLDRIWESFNQANDAIQYRFIYGYGCIVFAEQEDGRHDQIKLIDSPISRIIECLKCCDYQKTINALDALFEQIINDNSRINIIQLSINQLYMTLNEYLMLSGIKIRDVFEDDEVGLQYFYNYRTVGEIKSWFSKAIDNAIRLLSYKTAEKPSKASQIDDFIRTNYHRDINIDAVADYVGVSYSFVRKVFKDEKQTTITEYINELRIAEAKRLLLETKMTLSEVAKHVGYNSDQSFLRNFKKIVGLTPSEYRERVENVRFSKEDKGEP